MAADAFKVYTRTPALASIRMPTEPSPYGLAANAHLIWHLAAHGNNAATEVSGNPGEEYKSVCEFMRLYSTLRFYQLALLLGTSGSIVTAISSNAVRTSFARAEFLKTGGLVISLAFLVMEFRASSHWHRLRNRGNVLAQALRFECFPAASRWNPLTTSGAGLYLHVAVATLWLTSLLLRLQPGL